MQLALCELEQVYIAGSVVDGEAEAAAWAIKNGPKHMALITDAMAVVWIAVAIVKGLRHNYTAWGKYHNVRAAVAIQRALIW